MLKNITFKETPERLMVGYNYETNFYDAGEVWKECNVYEKIRALDESSFSCDDIDPCDSMGLTLQS